MYGTRLPTKCKSVLWPDNMGLASVEFGSRGITHERYRTSSLAWNYQDGALGPESLDGQFYAVIGRIFAVMDMNDNPLC